VIVRRLLGGEETRAIRTDQVFPRTAIGAPGVAAGMQVTPEAALNYSDVWACVRILSATAGTIPLQVFRRSDEGRERVTDSIAARLLARPAPYMTPSVFLSGIVTQLALYGNAFVTKYRDPGQPVAFFGLIHPSRVQVKVDAGEPIFQVSPGSGGLGASGEFTRRDVIHVKTWSMDGIVGLSPISCSQAIGLGAQLQKYGAQFFANSAHPSGVLQTSQRLTPEAVDRLKDSWTAKFQGTENAAKVAVLEEGLSWTPITLPLHDQEFLAQRRYSAREISAIYGVPGHLIGAETGSSMTYANVEQSTQAFLAHALQPYLKAAEEAFAQDEDLFSLGGTDYPEFILDAILRPDARTRAEVYSTALAGQAWMTPAEVRQRENLGPIPAEMVPQGDETPSTDTAGAA
jgi:HK97 family phage portal protein